MVKMVALKKSAADRKAEKDAMGEGMGGTLQSSEDREGPTVHLDHHHLKNMKVGGALKSGHEVSLSARGHVERSETRSENGEDRHSATIRVTHMGMEHEGRDADGDERANLRNEIEKIHGASEEKREQASEKKGMARAVAGKKV